MEEQGMNAPMQTKKTEMLYDNVRRAIQKIEEHKECLHSQFSDLEMLINEIDPTISEVSLDKDQPRDPKPTTEPSGGLGRVAYSLDDLHVSIDEVQTLRSRADRIIGSLKKI